MALHEIELVSPIRDVAIDSTNHTIVALHETSVTYLKFDPLSSIAPQAGDMTKLPFSDSFVAEQISFTPEGHATVRCRDRGSGEITCCPIRKPSADTGIGAHGGYLDPGTDMKENPIAPSREMDQGTIAHLDPHARKGLVQTQLVGTSPVGAILLSSWLT